MQIMSNLLQLFSQVPMIYCGAIVSPQPSFCNVSDISASASGYPVPTSVASSLTVVGCRLDPYSLVMVLTKSSWYVVGNRIKYKSMGQWS